MRRINMNVKCPANAQLAYFPMKECTVAAGFKNLKYKRANKYPHYGVDFDSLGRESYYNLASGYGEVIGTEMNSNSIGGVIVIKYKDVYVPKKKKIMDLIFRIYHNEHILVKKGDKVVPYQKIGTVSDCHKWYNHTHIEIDTDTKYPFYTPQVAEGSSKLLIRKGATDKSILNPMDVLVVGKEQSVIVHPLAIYADKKVDAPKYFEI